MAKAKKIKIKPLDDRVVIELVESEEKTDGGIYLPDSAKEKPTKGRIIAIGPGGKLKSGKRAKPEVNLGDLVIVNKWGGTEIKIEGREYSLMRENDILAVIL